MGVILDPNWVVNLRETKKKGFFMFGKKKKKIQELEQEIKGLKRSRVLQEGLNNWYSERINLLCGALSIRSNWIGNEAERQKNKDENYEFLGTVSDQEYWIKKK